MENGIGLPMREAFAGLDFNSKRLEQRFVRTMETLAGQPDKAATPSGMLLSVRYLSQDTSYPAQNKQYG